MSHHLYNPNASRNQSSTPGQYGFPSIQAERDPQRTHSHLELGSSFSSYGASSATPANSGGMLPSLLPQSMIYRPEQSRAIIDESIKRSVDMHIRRAREDVRLLGIPMHQPIDQGTCFTSTQRDEFLSSDTGMVSYPMSSTSASQGYRHSGVESGSSSLDWLSNFKTPTAVDPSKFYSSSASSNSASSGGSWFNASSERNHDIQATPGLGDFEYPVPDKPVAPTESSKPKYTSKSAASILLQFGLEKKDLDLLSQYPEDQITPANLPFILRQIRIEKSKRARAAVQSKPSSEPQPTESVSGMDSHSLSSSGGARMHQEKMSSAVLQKNIMTNYGHAGNAIVTKDESKTQGSTAAEQMKKQQMQKQLQQQQKHPVSQTGQGKWPPVPPASLVFTAGGPLPNVIPPVKRPVSKCLPTTAMMNDYAASTPRIFPHTCCLCNKECTHMQDWISHQNTSLHLDSCKLLRIQYPEWDGKVMHELSDAGKNAKLSSSTSPETSQHCHQKVRHGSRSSSSSPSPRRHRGSEGRREKHRSGSRSPHNSRYTRRSRSRSHSPRYYRPTSSRYRSRSRSSERQSSPRRRFWKRSPQRRRDDRRSPRKRSRERRSSSRSSDERRSSSRSSDERRSSSRRTNKRRSSSGRSNQRRSPQRKKLSSAEILAKKLFETSAAQSLTKDSDLETVVKTLAPALIAELTKVKSTPSSSIGGKPSSSSTASSSSFSSTAKKTELTKTPSKEKRTMPEYSADKSSESQPSTTLLPVQQLTPSQPESAASNMQQQAPGRPTEAAVETKNIQTDPVTAVKAQMHAALDNNAPLTVGERIEQHLTENSLWESLKPTHRLSAKLKSSRQMLVTNLPQYYDGCYTEDDLFKLLKQYGHPHYPSRMHIIPQKRMAFVMMPRLKSLIGRVDIYFKGSQLRFYAVECQIGMEPLGFYNGLMELMGFQVCDRRDRIVFINNISWSEAMELRETLRKNDRINNFLPLLNKVFIEFLLPVDADRIGVWYSLLKRVPGHQVHRKMRNICYQFYPPILPENALPDSKEAVAGATVPPMEFGIPQGSVGPCWVTLRTHPFLFPTASPWYIIPDYLTVKGQDDIEKASGRGSMFHTIMLTGLPKGNYSHEDVAKLVCPYFPKQNLHTLYYNVVVLPLQRRAFVFFTDWTTCCDFVRDHINNPVSVKFLNLSVHFVLQHMGPESSEEMMYTTLMKWSNAGVPESESLEERLLSVEISEASVEVIREVMEGVASIGTFVSFLPLAKRICVEMADSSGVTKVVEKYSTFSPDSFNKAHPWSKIQHFESVKILKQRLQDSSEITVNLELDTISDKAETSVKALPQVEQRTLSEPGSTAQGPEASHMQQQAAGRTTEAAVETMIQTDPVTAAKTQTGAASDNNAPLTVGEMIEQRMTENNIWERLKPTDHLSQKCRCQMLITNLPQYYDGCYTEEDLVKLLEQFGYQHTERSIYIIPQKRMALVIMPTLVNLVGRWGIYFKGSQLYFYAVQCNIAMEPIGLYKGLMELMSSPVRDRGDRIVFINNISWSEAMELRETLRKIDRIDNFLPLLNKVFIAFWLFTDADRIGVWYSLLKRVPGHEVHRLRVPYIGSQFRPPRLPEKALPDSKDAVAGATVLATKKCGIPQGSIGPCWVTMRTRPFLFPTVSPWYIIPDYLTVKGQDDIEKACGRGSMFHTIMLTGLPKGNYSHEDVVELVWPYFPKQNLHTLYYNVVVLPLQRRAFVFFTDWTSCCDFVRDHIKNPVFVEDSELSVHFVLQHIGPQSSEEMMYTTLMKWSNAGVPESESLEERLLSVEISEASVEVIGAVMEGVASVASFVSFLPLAKRICIEMADSSGVNKVVEKYSTFSPESLKTSQPWSKIQHFESVKSLKQRLQNSSEITINFELATISYKAETSVKALPQVQQRTGSEPESTAQGPEASHMQQQAAGRTTEAAVEAKLKGGGMRTRSMQKVINSLQKQAPGHEVDRLNVVDGLKDCASPTAAVLEHMVKMKTHPFQFPFRFPSFTVPDHLMVRELDDIEKASDCCSMFNTIMLTGLPNGNYKHEDVAKLVWPYFPKQNLHTLYYNVVVLPLQRRAFVFFADWTTCCNFVQDFIKKTISIKHWRLSVHFVLQHIGPEFSEEMMYTSLMNWSDAKVLEPQSLAERLLSVEISEQSMEVIKAVMEGVASVAIFVSFLPLANRICIEMADSSGLTKVLEKYSTFSPDSLNNNTAWSKVQRFESLKSLKQRLQDASEITINFEPDTISVKAKSPAANCQTQPPTSERSDKGSQPALQTSEPGGSTTSEPVTAQPSATVASDVAMKEEPGTEITMDSAIDPESNKDVEKAEVKGESSAVRCQTQPPPELSDKGSQLPLQTSEPGGPTLNSAVDPEANKDEYVVPKSGYICNLCSVFYLNESTAKDLHCSSQRHYDNLQKHYQKLQQQPSRSSKQSSEGFVSD